MILPKKKKSVKDLTEADVKGKKVLLRVDFNTPLDRNCRMADDSKIRDAVPTIYYLMQRGARVILASHLGYFVGAYNSVYSMKQFVPCLSHFLSSEVQMARNCIGPDVERKVNNLRDGEVLLLENLKFHKGEMSNDSDFAEQLASLADLYVNDAFSIAHRGYASTVGVTNFLRPAVAGFLMQKEHECLAEAIQPPSRSVVAIVGGSRLSTKAQLIKSLLGKVDKLLLGGAIVFAFYVAQNRCSRVGSSLVEGYHGGVNLSDEVMTAKSLLNIAKEAGKDLLLPEDIVVGNLVGSQAKKKVVLATNIPDDWMGLDVGPMTIQSFNNALDSAKMIIWNGPMGVYEYDKFADGTKAIAMKLAELTREGVQTIIVGGDTVAAVEKLGLSGMMSHVSTGQLASLAMLSGHLLPAVAVLDNETIAPAKNKNHGFIRWLLPLTTMGGIAVLLILKLRTIGRH